MKEYKISLPTAILININIMLGAGIFINTPTLVQRAGLYGGFLYLLVGLLMFPLILSIAQLLKKHPSGGFYTFAEKEINPFMGFLSGWSYFTSKLASCMLMIHVSVTLLQHIFPLLRSIHPFLLDLFILSLFCALNLLNIKAGSTIQKMFIGFKTFPIFFAMLAGLFFLQPHYAMTPFPWEGFQSSIPLVIYAIIGFEAACSVSSKIKDAPRNAPLAVLISFVIVIVIATIYQTIFYGVLSEELLNCSGHCDTFPALIQKLMGDTLLSHQLQGMIHLAIASSTLGAAYGIIFSNSWNLHILAEKGHLWLSVLFKRQNSHLIPFACVLMEGAICLLYLAVSQGVLIPLQQLGALGCIVAYTFSVYSLLRSVRKNPSATRLNRAVPFLALISCSILLSACIRSFFINGMHALILYSFLLLFGLCMFIATSKKSIEKEGKSVM